MRSQTAVCEIAQQYAKDGYYFPIKALEQDEVQTFHSQFLDFYEHNRQQLNSLSPREQYSVLSETHTAQEWVYHLAAHPRVLDAVESVLGPNLLIWGSRWFLKMPGDKTYVSWHQDGTYWGLHPPEVTTAWIALSESTMENGCMRVVPGSHKAGMLPQTDTYDPENALSRGQEIAVEVEESEAIGLILQPGEMSLHHIGIVHGSKVNTSGQPRIGIAVRYITPEVVQDQVEHPLAMLVRGSDDSNHFEHLPPPQGNMEDAQSKAVERMMNSILDRKQ